MWCDIRSRRTISVIAVRRSALGWGMGLQSARERKLLEHLPRSLARPGSGSTMAVRFLDYVRAAQVVRAMVGRSLGSESYLK